MRFARPIREMACRLSGMSPEEYEDRKRAYPGILKVHLKRYWWAWLIIMAIPFVVARYFFIGINFTESLPDHVFVGLKYDTSITRGQYVMYTWHGGAHYPKGIVFVKIIQGIPGDVVSMDANKNFFVNGQFVGQAKDRSELGEKLKPGFTGIIPAGHFYAMTPHKDSLDSRYAVSGLIRNEAVVGRAIPLF